MATEIKIITLDKLGKNNTLFKKYIDNADAKAIKTVGIVGRTLKFYREEILTEDSVAVKEITIPETDLSTINSTIGNLQTVVNKLDGEDTVDGSVKAQIKALKTELEGQITSSEYNDTEIKKTIKANTDAIGVLNGTGDGSVDKKVTDAVAKIVTDAPESYDTLKEIATWISTHENDASAMNQSIQTNKTDIANLVKLIGTLPEGEETKTIIEYIDSKIDSVDFSEAIADAKKAGTDAQTAVSNLEKRVETLENTTFVEATDAEIEALFS